MVICVRREGMDGCRRGRLGSSRWGNRALVGGMGRRTFHDAVVIGKGAFDHAAETDVMFLEPFGIQEDGALIKSMEVTADEARALANFLGITFDTVASSGPESVDFLVEGIGGSIRRVW